MPSPRCYLSLGYSLDIYSSRIRGFHIRSKNILACPSFPKFSLGVVAVSQHFLSFYIPSRCARMHDRINIAVSSVCLPFSCSFSLTEYSTSRTMFKSMLKLLMPILGILDLISKWKQP